MRPFVVFRTMVTTYERIIAAILNEAVKLVLPHRARPRTMLRKVRRAMELFVLVNTSPVRKTSLTGGSMIRRFTFSTLALVAAAHLAFACDDSIDCIGEGSVVRDGVCSCPEERPLRLELKCWASYEEFFATKRDDSIPGRRLRQSA